MRKVTILPKAADPDQQEEIGVFPHWDREEHKWISGDLFGSF